MLHIWSYCDSQAASVLQIKIWRLRLDPNATLHYEVMPDALVWSDEILRGRKVRETWCMRPVFRYRTGLILGLQLVEFEEPWGLAKTILPNWIGFSKWRCERNVELELLYQNFRKKLMDLPLRVTIRERCTCSRQVLLGRILGILFRHI